MPGTDDQIREGFERVTSALTPPPDATERVAQRITQRRRMRRTGVVACGAVAVVAAVGTAALLAGGDGTGTVADDPAPGGSVVLTRPDGSTYPFDDVTVECGPGTTGRTTVLASTPRRLDGLRVLAPFLYVEANMRNLELGRTYELPLKGDSDEVPLVVFVADAAVNDQDGNEVSSSEPGAAGTVRVLEASCEPVPTLRVELDTTLGSEVDQGTLDVAGTLR